MISKLTEENKFQLKAIEALGENLKDQANYKANSKNANSHKMYKSEIVKLKKRVTNLQGQLKDKNNVKISNYN